MEEKNKKVSILEKISLKFRKKWLANKIKTFFLAVILIILFMVLNIGIRKLELPEIDVTANQIYTLSNASKKAIEQVSQDVKIYVYGFVEGSALTDFLKQYNEVNPKITYEIITEETNPQMVRENELSEGYMVLIVKSGEAQKIIDAQNEFYSYDYTTYQQVDITEQTITNSILALNVENKPNIYFVQGHGEFSSSELASLNVYLENEAYTAKEINLITTNSIPEDCNLLAILSPSSDLLEAEVTLIQNYINAGGDIIFTQDMLSEEVAFPNLQKVLDLYGVSVENGYIVESDSDYAVPSYPYMFMPHISPSNDITKDIYTDSSMLLVYASKLNKKSQDELNNLQVTIEPLLYSGETSYFINDLSSSLDTAIQTAEIGSFEIASLATKTISNNNETVESKLIISAVGSFMSDYSISALESQTPLSGLASNRDFILNSIANLTEREGTLTIRKDMSNATYTPTESENRIVLIIIFAVPVLIIFIGIMIGHIRKKRK